jgi:hypothetical protein
MSGIYLSFVPSEIENKRSDLFNTLLKAGFQVYPTNTQYDNSFFSHIREEISKAYCSVHILGLQYGELINGDSVSVAEYQYKEALARLKNDPDFKIFVWFPYSITEITDGKQLAFVSEIRNNIQHGMVFSNTSSPIQLVDDLRVSVKKEDKLVFDIKSTDVFLVYNQLDDNEANEIADMLSDIIPVEKLNIVQDSEMDYSEFCAQQIGKSKLAVVYFKESADWALPFAQQIWKKIGGASSHTPILLIGDEDPETNINKKFKAPKVVSLIVAGELIPLEIKVQYDKIVESIH